VIVTGMRTKRSSFGSDRGLQARMLITLFLLGGLYAAFVVVLLAAGAGAITVSIVIAAVAAAQLLLSDPRWRCGRWAPASRHLSRRRAYTR
jgi:heat shock protein HtpX